MLIRLMTENVQVNLAKLAIGGIQLATPVLFSPNTCFIVPSPDVTGCRVVLNACVHLIKVFNGCLS